MPKIKHRKDTLKKYASLDEHLKLVDDKLYCGCCNSELSPCISHVKQHLVTNQHKSSAASKILDKPGRQITLAQVGVGTARQESFSKDVMDLFAKLDLPIFKVEHPAWTEFQKKYIPNLQTPSRRTLNRRFLPQSHEEVMSLIKTEIGDSPFYCIVDEAHDATGRSILNILIGKLSEAKAFPARLIASIEVEKVNSETVSRAIDTTLCMVLGMERARANFMLLISDAASYMIKAGEILKVLYPILEHVLCTVHGLHRVCSEVTDEFPLINSWLAYLKKVFLHSRKRKDFYKEVCPTLPFPPDPVPTRFGTWQEAANFSCENFDKLQEIVVSIPHHLSDAASVREAKKLARDDNLLIDLIACTTSFGFLPAALRELETNTMTLEDQLSKLENVKNKLATNRGQRAGRIAKKFDSVLSKNKALPILKDVSKVLKGEQPTNSANLHKWSPSQLKHFKFAQLTSCDVERSFSKRKSILRPNRRRMNVKTLEMLLVVNHFYGVKDTNEGLESFDDDSEDSDS